MHGTYFYWVANNSRATVGQSRSGESGKSGNLAQSGTLQSGNRAFDSVGPIGQVGQSGQSGKLTNRAIGQIGQSGNWKIEAGLQEDLDNHPFCRVAHLGRLQITWPDWSPCQTGPLLSCQTDSRPDWCQIAISQSSQSGSRAPDCQTVISHPVLYIQDKSLRVARSSSRNQFYCLLEEEYGTAG